eukprot:XP_011674853.1 PREDICTED: transient receptor potential cation channel subfamily M member 4-like [Strongylocentrotus purpuratus]
MDADWLLENMNGHSAKPKPPSEDKDEDMLRDSGVDLSWWQKFKFFYNAPMITFRHNVLSYIVFLVLYSYVILGKFAKDIFEYVLIVWVVSLFTEEFRQIAQGENISWSGVAFIVDHRHGTILGPGNADHLSHILSLNLTLFFILAPYSPSASNLDPNFIMTKGWSMVDLMFFVAILCVFLIGYGIASQAILFPNETNVSVIMRGILMRSYFQIFGELFLEVIEELFSSPVSPPHSPFFCELKHRLDHHPDNFR